MDCHEPQPFAGIQHRAVRTVPIPKAALQVSAYQKPAHWNQRTRPSDRCSHSINPAERCNS
eukprot:3145760-Amphidinium_carterae.2